MQGSLGVTLTIICCDILILGTMLPLILWDRSRTKRDRNNAALNGRAFREELANIKAEMQENREKFKKEMEEIRKKGIKCH